MVVLYTIQVESEGWGGILRDHQGKLVYAFSIPLGFFTNNTAEIKAALQGIYWREQHEYKRVILEVDSELLRKWRKNTITIPWRSRQDVNTMNKFQVKLIVSNEVIYIESPM